jgi:hypothetical protein
MTSRSNISNEVTNPRNVSKAEREKAAKQLQLLEHQSMEKERWRNRNKSQEDVSFNEWLDTIPVQIKKRKKKNKSGGKIMIGYKAGGKV